MLSARPFAGRLLAGVTRSNAMPAMASFCVLPRPAMASGAVRNSRRQIMTDVASAEHLEELVKAPQPPALVFYTASWCSPCREVEPLLKEISDGYGTRAKVLRVDVEEQAEVARASGVSAVPYFAIYRGGFVVERLMGYNPEALCETFGRHVLLEEELAEKRK
eukprot:TRINITY_DN18512_c0_g1_i1.p1 TRINITY_DN18512_c0_g1~~TRINITY_DN18512_c0_g1_i1.p1  ORF type:complete len:190 (+),score=38.76 TRINITY_DN18512_c0_g1_i1:82-570(+)